MIFYKNVCVYEAKYHGAIKTLVRYNLKFALWAEPRENSFILAGGRGRQQKLHLQRWPIFLSLRSLPFWLQSCAQVLITRSLILQMKAHWSCKWQGGKGGGGAGWFSIWIKIKFHGVMVKIGKVEPEGCPFRSGLSFSDKKSALCQSKCATHFSALFSVYLALKETSFFPCQKLVVNAHRSFQVPDIWRQSTA